MHQRTLAAEGFERAATPKTNKTHFSLTTARFAEPGQVVEVPVVQGLHHYYLPKGCMSTRDRQPPVACLSPSPSPDGSFCEPDHSFRAGHGRILIVESAGVVSLVSHDSEEETTRRYRAASSSQEKEASRDAQADPYLAAEHGRAPQGQVPGASTAVQEPAMERWARGG